MDDIVAIRGIRRSGEAGYFLTWGRIFDPTDDRMLLDAVAPYVARMMRAELAALEVCESLQEASDASYFYEEFFQMCQQRIPFGEEYEQWRARMQEAVKAGKEIHFLG